MTGSIFPMGALEVTTSDTANLPKDCWGIKCNTAAGNVHFTDRYDVEHTWPIALGETIPVGVRKIWASNTTATGLAVYLL